MELSNDSLQSREIAPADRPPRGTFIYLAAALLLAAGIYACCRGAPLIWDGAYQLNVTLIGQKPYVYFTRFHTAILWQPVVWLSGRTDNLPAIWTAYGMPFLIAPVVAVLICWWLVRKHAPRLMLWVLFGVAIGPLPGQIFVINDSIFQQHLFWPLFLAIFVPLDAGKWLVLAMLAVFEFAHPIGIALFFIIAAASGVLLLLEPARQRQLALRIGVALILGFTALWKTLHWVDDYAAKEANWKAAMQCWQGGVKDFPIYGMLCMWTAAGLLFWIRRQHSSKQKRWIALIPALLGSAIWIYWACDEHRWAWASEYRRWIVPLTAPFYVLCFLDYTGSRPPRRGNTFRLDGPWMALLAGLFAIVITIQSIRFGSMINQLRANMDAFNGVLVPESTVQWSAGTPLQHWTITDLAIAVQGKNTQKLLVSPKWVLLLYGQAPKPDDKPVFPNFTIYEDQPYPNSNGWYDMRPILRALPPPNPWKGTKGIPN